jgi:hypothetical protein
MSNVTCLDGGLFPEPARQPNGDTSRGRGFGEEILRRTLKDRQLAAIARGQHPLSVALRGPLPLHPAARRDGDRTADGSPRCGSCRYRRHHNPGHARSHPKCLAYPTPRSRATPDGERIWTEFPRVTNGEGTDVAYWWPACIDYLEKGDR